jgi:hypothetical protein
MATSFKRTALTAAVLGLISAALGGCTSTTYGTGVSPGKQTIQDIGGLVNLGGDKKGGIDYKPRPPIVAPPANAALPTPGTHAVATADWPNDPDVAAKARKAAASRLSTGDAKIDAQYDPDITLPIKHDKTVNWNDANTDRPGQKEAGSAAQDAETRKLIADAKSAVSVDANGNPIRKTLSDPPVVYRAPDPTAPTEFKAASKKFHWPWTKSDEPASPTSAGLTDDAASSEKTTQ